MELTFVATFGVAFALVLQGCGGGSSPSPPPPSTKFRGCGVPVEQVRLSWPNGDVASSGKLRVAFIGGSDAVKVTWDAKSSHTKLAIADVVPERIEPYDGFDSKNGSRLLNLASISGLTSGRYVYRIVDDPSSYPNSGCTAAKTVTEGSFTFGPKDKAIRLGVMGDMGVNYDSPGGGCFSIDACHGARRVKELIYTAAPNLDAVFNIGDIAYAAGNDGIWDDYGREIANISANIPWMTAIGNHEWGPDAECECGTPYSFRFPMPTNEGAGIDFTKHRARVCATSVHKEGQPSCPGADNATALSWSDMVYSVDIGDVRIVVVSTQHGILPGTDQFAWLNQTLRTNPLKWQVVFGHIDACYPCDPLYPNTDGPCYCWPYGGPSGVWGATSMNVVQRLVASNKLPVDLLMAGHTHEYYVRNCTGMPSCVAEDEPPLVVVGGAGYGGEESPGDLGKERPGPPTPVNFRQCSYAPYGFIELLFGDDAIEVHYRSVNDTGRSDFNTLSCAGQDGSAGGCPAPGANSTEGPTRCTPASFSILKTHSKKPKGSITI